MLWVGAAIVGVAMVAAKSTLACSIIPDERSPNEVRLQSVPVEGSPSCGFTNGGVGDYLSAGDAEDLGNGRVAQRLSGDVEVLVADCMTREATILRGALVPALDAAGKAIIDSCGGPVGDWTPLIGPDAPVSVTFGPTLTGMVTRLTALGAIERDPVEAINTDPWGQPVWPRDQVNLLCGCGIYYPTSPGAVP